MAILSSKIFKKRGVFKLLKVYSALFGKTADVSTIYDKAFFQKTIEREAPSAEAAVRILCDEFRPESVIDVGCGAGLYLRAFEKLGVSVFGCDGSITAIENNMVSRDCLRLVDLRKPQHLGRRWDLCICFEVAEHLHHKHARCLVETLTSASDLVVFTAARPGQGGTDHVNEQPQDYWKQLFKSHGFVFKGNVTEQMKNRMRENNVIFWVEQNLMVFVRQA
jgi:cyclopropane fatty-acyl-phospholipid synthase-like methyltransferase